MQTTVIRNKLGASLEAVLEYKNPEIVARIKREHGMSQEEVEKLFEDTLMYLFLCSVVSKPIAPTKQIDKGWHEFLMYTRDYRSFCDEYLGIFVHHNPVPIMTKSTSLLTSQDTLGFAIETFGEVGPNWYSKSQGDECSADSDCHGDDSCGGDV